jgi:hypothetical protein
MIDRCAFRLTNGSVIPACVLSAIVLPAGASGARAASPAAPPSPVVSAALGGRITLARHSSRQLTEGQAVPVDHDTWEQELRLALGKHPFTSASTRTKGEWGRITIKHIYRENSETGCRGLLFRVGRGAW